MYAIRHGAHKMSIAALGYHTLSEQQEPPRVFAERPLLGAASPRPAMLEGA